MLSDCAGIGAVGGGADGVAAEVLAVPCEVDGEGGDPAAVGGADALGQSGHGAGVQAAGEQCDQGDVRDHLARHDVIQQFPYGGDGGGQVVGVRAGLQRPVALFAHTVAADPQQMAGLQFPHVAEGHSARGTQEEQRVAEFLGGGARFHQRVGEDGLGFRAEEHSSRGRVVVEGLDPETVADEEEFLACGVPDGDGVHAVQAAHEVGAPLEVSAQRHLGVAGGGEPMPVQGEFGAQLTVVVDLAAVGDHGARQVAARAAFRGGHGLGSALQVDDRQAPVSERGVGAEPAAAGVRAAADQGPHHGVESG